MRDQNGKMPSDGDHNGKGKYNYNNQQAELKQVHQYLTENNASATMVADALNIYRPNLTRYKHMLEEDGKLFVTHKDRCKVTGRIVCYLSCNLKLKGGVNGK